MLSQKVIDFMRMKIASGYSPKVVAEVLEEKGYSHSEIREKIRQMEVTAELAEKKFSHKPDHDTSLNFEYLTQQFEPKGDLENAFANLRSAAGIKNQYLNLDTFVKLKDLVWKKQVKLASIGAEPEAALVSDLQNSQGFLHSLSIIINHFNEVEIRKPKSQTMIVGVIGSFVILSFMSALLFESPARVVSDLLIRLALLIPMLLYIPSFFRWISHLMLDTDVSYSDVFKITAVSSIFVLAFHAILGLIPTLVVTVVVVLAYFNYLRAKHEGSSLKMVVVCICSGVFGFLLAYLLIFANALILALAKSQGWML